LWCLAHPCPSSRKRQITPRYNGVITPVLIVLVQFMDFPARITLSSPLGDVEPRRSSTVETSNVDGGEVVLFSFVLDEFVRVTKARQVPLRLHRQTPLHASKRGNPGNRSTRGLQALPPLP